MKKLYRKIKNYLFPSRVVYVSVPYPVASQINTPAKTSEITPDAVLDFQSVLDGIVATTRRQLTQM